MNKLIRPQAIESMKEFMSIKLSLGFQFSSLLNKRLRKLLDKVNIQFRQLEYYKIRNNELKKTASRKLMMSDMRGSIAIDDLMVIKGIMSVI